MNKAGIIVLVMGVIGLVLGGAILVISLALPVMTNGRTSWDEAMLGIIPGILLLGLSFVVTVAALVLMYLKRKNSQTRQV